MRSKWWPGKNKESKRGKVYAHLLQGRQELCRPRQDEKKDNGNELMDTFEPIQSKEFRKQFGGMRARRIFDSVGKFGEMKFLAKLQIKDASGEVVYEEKHLIK